MLSRLFPLRSRPTSLITLVFLLTSGCGGDSAAPSTSLATPTASATPTGSAASPSLTAPDSTSLPADAAATVINVSAADFVARPTPYIVGAAAHFALDVTVFDYDPAKSAKIMADSKISSFRDDVYWNQVSPEWDVTGIHLAPSLLAFEKLSNARPLLILNNGNPAIPETLPPVTDKGRSAFAKFAGQVASVTAATNPILEIWNEWNLRAVAQGTTPPPLVGAGDASDTRSALYYAQLATAATAAVKAARPGSTVLVGANGNDVTWEWTLDVVKRGALQQADGLSTHLYNQCETPAHRTATRMLDRLDVLEVSASKLMGKQVPIYVTEWGWPGGTNTCSLSSSQIADNVGQFLLRSAATPYVMGSWIYQLKDTGTDATDIEDNFGLYDYGFNAKPQQCAFADASAQIAESQAMTFEQVSGGITVVKARTSRGLRLFVWTADATIAGSVTVGGSVAFSARRLCRTADTIASGRTVSVGPTPIVIDVPDVGNLAISVKRT